jgi:hypothetical protein
MSVSSPRRSYEGSTKGAVAYGVSAFAGVMLLTVALFQVMEGIAAIAKDEIYVTGVDYVYKFDATAWGWGHLIIGLIAIATGVGLLMGQTWASITGIAIAFVSALSYFAYVPYYPLWSIIIIAFDVFVIWALCVQLSREDAV